MFDDNDVTGSDGFDFFDDADDYSDLDVQANDGWDLPDGTHSVSVSKAGPIETKNGKTFIVQWTNDDGKSFTQFLNRIEPGDAEKTFGNTNLRDIKRQERVNVLCSLGVPQSGIAKLDPESLVGIEGYLTISKNKTGRQKFRKFEVKKSGPLAAVANAGGNGSPVVSATASAPANLSEFGI